MKIRAAIAALCLSAALGGCGQKGSLYLPDAVPKAVPAAPAGTATPATPAAPAADDPATRRKTPTKPDPESSQ